jgi:hypothetical protein
MSNNMFASDETALTPNVIPIRLRVTERHRSHLLRWLAAGRRMGLHDADVSYWTPVGERHEGYVLIWVRENADPAYRVIPSGARWEVIDHLRNHTLGRFASFEAALHFIRPFAASKVVPAGSRLGVPPHVRAAALFGRHDASSP